MVRASGYKSSFSSGVISPYMYGRIGTAAYQNGAETLQNVIVLPEGAVINRPGIEFIGYTKHHNKESRVIPFVFNREQAYCIEIGDQYMRFYRNQAPIVESAKTVTAITQASPGVVTSASHGYSNGDDVILSSVGGMVELEGRRVRVASVTTNTFAIEDMYGNPIDTTGYTAFSGTADAERIYEISSPYLEAEIDDVQFAQTADTMYLVHPSHKPRTLSRSGHTSWSISNFAPTADPFTSSDNYPSVIAFHEERLWMGSTNNDPQKLWASKSADFADFTTGTAAADALTYTVAAREINAITWIYSENYLLVGTNGGVRVIRGTGYDEPITPTNVQIKKHLGYSSGNTIPELVDNVLLFPHRVSRKIYSASYDGRIDRYVGRDASIRIRGLISTVTDMAFQEQPYNVLWARQSDGTMLGLTAEFAEEVTAWHTHITDGEFESIATVPGANEDELWMVVKRTINGNTARYIERLKKREDKTQVDCFFVDSGISYDGAATTAIGGLHHLEGKTVSVLVDGAAHPDVVVTNGGITLVAEAEKAQIGLPYTSRIKTLRQEGGSAIGSAQGRYKKLDEVIIRFYRSLGVLVGTDDTNLYQVPFRGEDDLMDTAVPLYSGDYELDFATGWEKEGQITIEQQLPLPMTITGMAIQYTVSDS